MNEEIIPPSSPLIEKAVLSAILDAPEVIDMLTEGSELFHETQHRAAFELLVNFRPSGDAPFDVNWISQRLVDSIDCVLIGPEFFRQIKSTHVRSRIQQDIAELRDRRARRLQIEIGQWAISQAADLNLTDFSAPLISGPRIVEEALEGLSECDHSQNAFEESLRQFEARYKGESSPMGIETIPELDRCLRGLHPGRVWVIGAFPGGGKSLVGSQILSSVCLSGGSGAFISLEMMARDQSDRMIIQNSGVPAGLFSDPKAYKNDTGNGLTKDHMIRIKRTAKRLNESQIRIIKPRKRTISHIVSSIRRAKREMGCQVAVVDYFQLISGAPRVKGQSKEEEVSEISHALQAVAQECELHVIILTQLNAEGETKHGRVIEEDADAFIVIEQVRDRNSPNYKEHLGMRIIKDRHNGNSGAKVPLILDRERLVFTYGLPPVEAEKTTKRRANI